MKAIALMMSVLAIAAAGCVSRDGAVHTPFTGVSVHRAYALAEADGWVRVDEAGGLRVWVRREAVALLNRAIMSAPTVQERLSAAADRVALAQATGKTDAQMVAAYNPSGKVVAQIGDGLTLSAILGGIVYAVNEANGNDSPAAAATPQTADRHDQNSTGVNVTSGNQSPVSVSINVTAMPPE